MNEENILLDYEFPKDLEFEPAPSDVETTVKIRAVDLKHKDEGRMSVILELPEYPNADDIFHTVWLPREDNDPKQNKRTMIALRRFYQAFSIDYSQPIDVKQDLVGAEAWAILTTEEWEGVTRNKIKAFTLPR